jgi:hypothetical protein
MNTCTCDTLPSGFTCPACQAKPRKAKPKATMTEQQFQRKCVGEFRKAYPNTIIASIRNEAKYGSNQKHFGMLANMAGRHAGIADLIVLAVRPPYGALFVELKTATGRLSPEQVQFMAYCADNCYMYAVAKDIDTFMKTVDEYMQIK